MVRVQPSFVTFKLKLALLASSCPCLPAWRDSELRPRRCQCRTTGTGPGPRAPWAGGRNPAWGTGLGLCQVTAGCHWQCASGVFRRELPDLRKRLQSPLRHRRSTPQSEGQAAFVADCRKGPIASAQGLSGSEGAITKTGVGQARGHLESESHLFKSHWQQSEIPESFLSVSTKQQSRLKYSHSLMSIPLPYPKP